MATTTPFAFNTGSTIVGTAQIGDIAIGTSEQDYSGNPGGVQWWMGPDEDLGYIIVAPDTGFTHHSPTGINAGIQFKRSTQLTESSFIELANYFSGLSFTGSTDAKTWLVDNGYPTSYPTLGPELLPNGQFNDSSYWELFGANQFAITNGKLVCTCTDGYQALNYCGYVLSIGKTYRVVFEISDYISGRIAPGVNYATGAHWVMGNGTYTFDMVCNNNAYFSFLSWGNPAFNGKIDNVSLKEVLGKYMGPNDIPSILSDGNTFAWYDSSDLTTITKDGSNLVSEWRDKLGSGNDLLSSGGSRPTWSANDGIIHRDHIMSTGAKTLDLPVVIYMVYELPYYTDLAGIFDGVYYAGVMTVLGFMGSWFLFPGGFGTPYIETYGVTKAAIHWNQYQNVYSYVNDGWVYHGAITGNNPGGFRTGFGSPWGQYGHVDFKEIIIRKITDSEEDRQAIYNHLANKYGLQIM